MGEGAPRNDLRRKYALLGSGVLAALALLYAVHLFYLQFLIVVWGAAVMAGFVIHEGKRAGTEDGTTPSGDADKWVRLQENLSAVEEKLSKSTDEAELRSMRLRKASLEQDIRKLRWSLREKELGNLGLASGRERLSPIPAKIGTWQRWKRERREENHLLDSVLEAEEVLASEPPASARARIAMIASDVRAHLRLLEGLEYGSRNTKDYGTVWAALTSVAEGRSLQPSIRVHASRKVKSRLRRLLDLAAAKGLFGKVPAGAEDQVGRDMERKRGR